jgi:hypothetical protein
MTIETELRARLAADATVAGLVVARIYPIVLPQKPTYPAITYSKVSGERLHTLAGAAGRAMPRISISAWSDVGYASVQTLAAAIRASLDGFNGTLTTIQTNIILDNEIDFYEDDTRVYRILQDYRLSHTET